MKWLKHILQGKWLGHPLHPAIVHLPTGLWPAALLFDLLSCWLELGGNPLVRTSFACIAGGLIAVPLAIPTGLADWSGIKPGKPARRIGIYHLILNVIATGLFLLNLWIRWDHVRRGEHVTFAQAALTFVGASPCSASPDTSAACWPTTGASASPDFQRTSGAASPRPTTLTCPRRRRRERRGR